MSNVRLFGISLMIAALRLCASGTQAAAQTFTTLLSLDGTDRVHSTAGLIRATAGISTGL